MSTSDTKAHWLLCIHEDSNANATLFRGAEPVFAVAEERLTRIRFAGGFPKMAVEACLNFAGITMAEVDVVLPANRTHFLPRISSNILPNSEHDYFGSKHKAWLAFQHQLSRGGLATWASEQLGKAALKGRFPQLASFVDHHTAHAYSAYMCSGYPDALAVTADNMGDGFSSKVFVCRDGRASYLYGTSARHSPGQFYGEIAQLLGYHNLLAGKVTGLSAYGDPRPAYPVMERLFALNAEGTGFRTPGLWKRSRRRGAYAELAAHKPRDVAAACQKRLEDVMVAYVEHALAETGARDVVLAGGTFANVVLNQRILDLAQVDRIFVHPAMTDQGISMGAGFAWLADQGSAVNKPLSNIYLGPGPTESDIEEALDEADISDTPGPGGIVARRVADIESAVVDALVSDRIVARYAGRMEYGLRALGNRSILYGTQDPTANDWLNKRLGRSEFMPFAPVTMAEHASGCYERIAGGELAASYMTVTFDTSDAFKEQSPAVVHIDGTARPQLLREQDNPSYHRILALYREKTGVASLVNTSFNLHREPIVCTPQDAIRAFRSAGIDVLALGPYLVEQDRGEGVELGDEGPGMDGGQG